MDTFLNAPDEIIADSPDDGQFIEQLVWSYTKGPEVDPDGTEVPVPEPISVSQAIEGLKTFRSFAEQQKEDYRGLVWQLAAAERLLYVVLDKSILTNRGSSPEDRPVVPASLPSHSDIEI